MTVSRIHLRNIVFESLFQVDRFLGQVNLQWKVLLLIVFTLNCKSDYNNLHFRDVGVHRVYVVYCYYYSYNSKSNMQ